ncbi:MAG: TRAP transporter permease, partial [Bacillota bacterium]
ASGLLGIWCLATSLQSYLTKPLTTIERVCFFVASICLIDPGFTTDLVGFSALAVGLAAFFIRTKQQSRSAAGV